MPVLPRLRLAFYRRGEEETSNVIFYRFFSPRSKYCVGLEKELLVKELKDSATYISLVLCSDLN